MGAFEYARILKLREKEEQAKIATLPWRLRNNPEVLANIKEQAEMDHYWPWAVPNPQVSHAPITTTKLTGKTRSDEVEEQAIAARLRRRIQSELSPDQAAHFERKLQSLMDSRVSHAPVMDHSVQQMQLPIARPMTFGHGPHMAHSRPVSKHMTYSRHPNYNRPEMENYTSQRLVCSMAPMPMPPIICEPKQVNYYGRIF